MSDDTTSGVAPFFGAFSPAQTLLNFWDALATRLGVVITGAEAPPEEGGDIENAQPRPSSYGTYAPVPERSLIGIAAGKKPEGSRYRRNQRLVLLHRVVESDSLTSLCLYYNVLRDDFLATNTFSAYHNEPDVHELEYVAVPITIRNVRTIVELFGKVEVPDVRATLYEHGVLRLDNVMCAKKKCSKSPLEISADFVVLDEEPPESAGVVLGPVFLKQLHVTSRGAQQQIMFDTLGSRIEDHQVRYVSSTSLPYVVAVTKAALEGMRRQHEDEGEEG